MLCRQCLQDKPKLKYDKRTLCAACYNRNLAAGATRRKPPTGPLRCVECAGTPVSYPTRGLCRKCDVKRRRNSDPAYRERQQRGVRASNVTHRDKRLEYDRRRNAVRTKSDDYKRRTKYAHIKRKYGLTPGQYDAMLAGGCQICGSTKRLHVDHCHERGHVRGILCGPCNTGLGFVERPSGWLGKALDYLRRTSG